MIVTYCGICTVVMIGNGRIAGTLGIGPTKDERFNEFMPFPG